MAKNYKNNNQPIDLSAEVPRSGTKVDKTELIPISN